MQKHCWNLVSGSMPLFHDPITQTARSAWSRGTEFQCCLIRLPTAQLHLRTRTDMVFMYGRSCRESPRGAEKKRKEKHSSVYYGSNVESGE